MRKYLYILLPLISLAVGWMASYFTADGLEYIYPAIEKSQLTPPGFIFPIVWTILYILMGIGMARVIEKGGDEAGKAKAVWIVQLLVNFSWSIIFFGMQMYFEAFICLIILWFLIIIMIFEFNKIDRTAALMQIPYLLWVSFAGYLNYAVWMLNK